MAGGMLPASSADSLGTLEVACGVGCSSLQCTDLQCTHCTHR